MKEILSITANEIHLWSADLAAAIDNIDIYAALLTPDELLRAARFQFPIHQQRFIKARAILRRILSCYLPNYLPKNLPIIYQSQGKPALALSEANQAIQFNLSHTQDYAVYAIGYQRVLGIDIEKVRDVNHHDLARRFFHPDEYAYLLQAGDPIQAFYQIWTRKEAILKALGHGLTIPLSSLSTHGATPGRIHFDHHDWFLSALPLDQLLLPHQYQGAIASNKPVDNLTVVRQLTSLSEF